MISLQFSCQHNLTIAVFIRLYYYVHLLIICYIIVSRMCQLITVLLYHREGEWIDIECLFMVLACGVKVV